MQQTVDFTHSCISLEETSPWAQATFCLLFILPVLGSTAKASLPVRDNFSLTTLSAFILLLLINLHSLASYRPSVSVIIVKRLVHTSVFFLPHPQCALWTINTGRRKEEKKTRGTKLVCRNRSKPITSLHPPAYCMHSKPPLFLQVALPQPHTTQWQIK